MLDTRRKLRLGAADDLLLAERKPGPRELAAHEGQVPGVGVARGVDVDPVHRDHVPPEHHRLQIEAAGLWQHVRDSGEEAAIDLLLASGAVLGGRAEVLEGAEARDGVERTEAGAGDLPCVVQVDVEPVPPARRRLRGGQRDTDPGAAPAPDESEQRAPAAAQVQHAPARPDPDLLSHVLVLALLSLLEAEREVTVVLGPAEVGQLTETEPEDPIDQRIREVEVLALGHVRAGASGTQQGTTTENHGLMLAARVSPGITRRGDHAPAAQGSWKTARVGGSLRTVVHAGSGSAGGSSSE